MPRDTSRNPYAVSLVKNCDTLTLYKIGRSKNWYYRFWCRQSSKYRRASTKTSDKREAEAIAKAAWRLDGSAADARLAPEMTFRYWADEFLSSQEKAVNRGELSPIVHRMDKSRLANVASYFGPTAIREISSTSIEAYRDYLFATKKNVAAATVRHYLISLKKVLGLAARQGAIDLLPIMPRYRAAELEAPRCRFSKAEYKILGDHLRKQAKTSEPHAELYDCVVFLVNTLLRPSEFNLLRYSNVRVSLEPDGKECVWVVPPKTKVKAYRWETPSMPGAVPAFRRMRDKAGDADAFLFMPDNSNRDLALQKISRLFNSSLKECGLYSSPDGVRTLYSLRHSGITWRIESGAAVYDVARWARTSVQMIEKHYARQFEFINRTISLRQMPEAKEKKKPLSKKPKATQA